MRVIAFTEEINPENRQKLYAKSREWIKELKQNPEKYARYMRLQDGTGIGFAMIGQYKGFLLLEANNEQQLANTVEFWIPFLKFTFVPIFQTGGAKRA